MAIDALHSRPLTPASYLRRTPGDHHGPDKVDELAARAETELAEDGGALPSSRAR